MLLLDINEKAKVLIVYFSCALVIIEVFGVVINYYQSIVESKLVVLSRLFSIVIRLSLVFFIFKLSSNIYNIGYIRLFESLLLVFLLCIISWPLLFNKVTIDYKTVKIILLKGIKIWPSILIYYLLLRLDRIAVEHYFDYTTVGLYSVSQQLIDQVMTFLLIIVSSLFPLYIYNERTTSIIKNKVLKIICIMFFVSIFAVVCIYLLGQEFIGLVYGGGFEFSYNILLVMMFVLPLSIVDYIINQMFIFTGCTKIVFIKNITGLFLLVSLYYFFARSTSINYFPIYIIITNIYMVLFSLIAVLNKRD
ncbi:hypothetical protein UB37_15810 [Photobacterium iliopiscarium]|uniref:oligosaccharide flippase family protein n=1 Tax=Photobacterium iliopiscarium TaxID=56192 RepID=UPI0005D3A095|nr:oligosaccharide flippase family protein [Photobacterium iliopiscarium]KJG19993.1 hypothetical protein UB37_15810 [Photobacterium iliopiscarium]